MATIILNELKFSDARMIKKNSSIDEDEVISYLRNNKFKFLGAGLYSSAYKKVDSNLVVKVSHNDDPCWINYYKFAFQHQKKSPHIPRVGKILQIGKNLNKFVVFMENLVNLTGNQRGRELDSILSKYHHIVNPENVQDYLKELNSLSPSFASLVSHLFHTKNACRWDLHGGNVMVRPSTGDFVITDPYAN